VKALDTTVAIDHLRGHSEATELIAGLLAAGEEVCASEIVRFEVLAGMRDGEREAVADFFASISWVPVEQTISISAGEMAQRFRRQYSGIDAADYLIAATAVVLQADLLTANVRHFPMIEGLEPPY
jgi:predicted nucleic acid-binding protein